MTARTYGAQAFAIDGGGTLLIAPTRAKDVVSVEGSVLGGPNHLPRAHDIVPVLAANLLDAGTVTHVKEALRGSLADRGISLAFGAGADRTRFSGQCLPEDLPFLLSTIAECLSEAAFPEAEVRSEKVRMLGTLDEAKTDTLARASIAFSQLLFDPAHVNYSRMIEAEEASVRNVTRNKLVSFQKGFGREGLIIAIAGDAEPLAARSAVAKALSAIPSKGLLPVPKRANAKSSAAAEKLIPIADKANVDVLLGSAIALHKLDPLFRPLSLLSGMLGGGFASHLMQTIRERDGLTYGVNASLQGFDDGADGYLRIWATFSPRRYTESVSALRREVGKFFSSGLTESALAKKKEETVGRYLVGLSTTGGLARTLHQITIDGRDLSYLGEYSDLIRAVSLAEVRAVAGIVPHKTLSFAASGTFPKQ